MPPTQNHEHPRLQRPHGQNPYPHHFNHIHPLAHKINQVVRLLPTHIQMPSRGQALEPSFNRFPLSLTNPITSTLHAHFTRQDDTLFASLRDKAIHITDPHTYKQAYCDFSPLRTRKSLLPGLTPLCHDNITTWPQILLRASTSSILLKSCKSMSTLEGASDSLSIPIRLLAAVLTEPLDTIHNRLPTSHPTIKHVSPPTNIHPSRILLLLPHLPRSLTTLATGLPNVCSCATPVVPELRGKGRRKTPSHMSSTVPSRSSRSPVRDIVAPPVAARLLL
jgi:hypothetical protein